MYNNAKLFFIVVCIKCTELNMLNLFFKAYIFNRLIKKPSYSFAKNFFFCKRRLVQKKKKCLSQKNSKRSFFSKPKLNRFCFLKYQRLGLLGFKKK